MCVSVSVIVSVRDSESEWEWVREWMCVFVCVRGAPLLDVDPSMDKYYIHYDMWDEIIYPFPNFNGATVMAL